MKLTTKEARVEVASFLKYGGTAGAVSTAIVGILLFFRPDFEPIGIYITTLTTFIVNALLVIYFKLLD